MCSLIELQIYGARHRTWKRYRIYFYPPCPVGRWVHELDGTMERTTVGTWQLHFVTWWRWQVVRLHVGYDVLRFTILSYNTLCFFSYSREGTEGLKKSVFTSRNWNVSSLHQTPPRHFVLIHSLESSIPLCRHLTDKILTWVRWCKICRLKRNIFE